MSYWLTETNTSKIRYQITCHTRQKPVSVLWYQFLAPSSGKCVTDISIVIRNDSVQILKTLSV